MEENLRHGDSIWISGAVQLDSFAVIFSVVQGCGIKWFIPTSVIQGNLPIEMGGGGVVFGNPFWLYHRRVVISHSPAVFLFFFWRGWGVGVGVLFIFSRGCSSKVFATIPTIGQLFCWIFNLGLFRKRIDAGAP